MFTDDPHLATVASWVGKSFAEMNALYPPRCGHDRIEGETLRGCWNLIRAANALRGISLPEYYATIDQRYLRTAFEPQPWDIVPVALHKLGIVTHVMLYLGHGAVIHAIQQTGVVSHPLTREPYWRHVAREMLADGQAGRRGFLRLRT